MTRQGRRPNEILGLVVFEFNVQTVFNADLHLDGIVAVGRHTVRVHPDVAFLVHVGHSTGYRDPNEISERKSDIVNRFRSRSAP